MRHSRKLLSAAIFAALVARAPASAADMQTTRTIDDLKTEILARAERKPQRSPASEVDPADIREAIAGIKTLDRDEWGRGFATEAARAAIDFTFEAFDTEHLIAGARVTNPSSRNILEKCGFQWSGVELHRFEALGSSTPVDCFRLSRGVWSSLKNWGSSTRRER